MPYTYNQASYFGRVTGQFLPQTSRDFRFGMKRALNYNDNRSFKRPRVSFNKGGISDRQANAAYDRAMAMSSVRRARSLNASLPEKKGVDTAIGPITTVLSTTNTNGDCFVLNLVQQGAGSWNRVGRKIHLKSLKYCIEGNLVATPSGGGQLSGSDLRIVLVWDKQPSGNAIPTFDEIFGRTIQDGTESCQFIDPPRYDNMDRFKVLRDKKFSVTPQAIPATAIVTGKQIGRAHV